jgi:uridine phosphorylase
MATDGASAERAQRSAGRQYHVDLAPGDVADFVLLVGDPARAELAAGMLDRIELQRGNREFVTYTGVRDDARVSIMATGIGPDNMEIAVIELSQCVSRPTLIRCGSCAGLQPDVEPGDLVISHAAYRLENTSLYFVGEGYPAVSDPEVLLCLVQAADGLGLRHHVGLTATAPGFYGAQARGLPGFPPRRGDLIADLQRQGVMNLEMEISALFSLATLGGARSGAVCAVFGSRHDDRVIDMAHKPRLERDCVETGLRAFANLAVLDRHRGARRYWHPGLGASAERDRGTR